MSESARPSLESVFREEHGRLLATLVRRYADLDLAEEAASDAIEAALEHWPVDGVPEKPGAWLLTTARRRAVDRLRRDQVYAARLAILQVEQDRTGPSPAADATGREFPDERLQLFFACAHPALHADDRVAITLRCLANLTTSEVARAFVIPSATAGQRISRAKKKIREARIPFRVPEPDELPARLPGVLQVVYSIFTEGYSASSGEDLIRGDLADEAVRLGRILHRLLPQEREAAGLLALMLSTHARRHARTDACGNIIMLDEQDRGLWDLDMIAEGADLVVEALTGGAPGPYAVQAAISALHDEAATAQDTDWPQIVELFGVLESIAPSPIVSVNRSAAVAMCRGPAAGLQMLDDLSNVALLQNYSPYFAARGDLQHRLCRYTEAAQSFRRAFELAGSAPERAYFQRRAESAESSRAAGCE
ncbi:sigma-70 family RNA polymerase sigma factor [Rhodococcus sp. G-MC3]|uniref:RNA polymerase sigma factor n=1 Tax=Rhodococcus sp. G-MC3 TaxID=3046209 RepID=UPI0024B9E10E|nr:sigma-70 family RNA polymerase sigma factor [Rhodococcus sp. G-MC3]MDJ0392066.1 sigma-70 family RNA polymerase sigma factor [Rhodococcus sp. G-MC3]